MSLVKRWRGLGHQIRLTVLLTASSAIVLGALLLMTGYMLTKSVTDSAQRQMHNSITARFIRERDWTVNDILDWNHLQRVREKEFQSGVFPPPRVRRAEGSTRGPRRHAVQRGGVRQPGAPESPTRGSASTSPPDSQPPSTPRAPNSQAPPDPALRNHMFQALYTNDGQPYPKFIPAEISVDRAVGWPKTLADASKLPTTFRHTVVNDPKGRFKVLCIFDVTEQLGELAGFKAALLALYPILVVIFALATYVGIGRSFQPLHKLLGQASTLGLHDRMETADQAEFGELAASINSYLDRLEKVVRQQEEFAVDAAHELSTPLTALRGQLEVALLKKGDAAALGEAAQSAIAQVSRLTRLVESLLLATRPRDGVVAPVDVQQALEEVQARWIDRYAARKVDLQLSAEAFKAAMPEEELESVMENLLANALKFSPAGTTVRITLDAGGHLVVQDQGPGIPEADRERVFERFERGTTKARGFGIGLYLVRRLLEQRGGAISIGESPIGARVEVALPA